MTSVDRSPLRSFREPNVRVFFGGLVLSGAGMWAQATAVVLVVRNLGGEGIELGIVTMCQFLPLLALGLYAGAVADRRNRRRLTIGLQALMAAEAVVFAVIDLADLENLPLVYLLALAAGTFTAFSNPARRTLATELVPEAHLANVISLGTSVVTGARIAGPAAAALLASRFGTGWVFLVAAATHLAFLLALVRMDTSRFYPIAPAPPSRTPVRDGLRAVWREPSSRLVLVLLGVVSTFAFNYLVALPLLVSDHLMEDEVVFGWLLSAMSVGNVAGSLITARLTYVSPVWAYGSAAVVALSLGALAIAPTTIVAFLLAVPVGMATAAFVSASTVVIQQRTDPRIRSRVLALTTVLFLGSKPVGGPITGVVGDTAGAVWATLYGAIITGLAVVVVLAVHRRINSDRVPVGR